jgi:hypothetical protein
MSALPRHLLPFSLLLAASSCSSSSSVRKEAMVTTPVVMPNAMCAKHGTVAMSSDKPGERMLCELQEPLGSHLPKCVCWDEGLIAQQREDTQQIHRQMEVGVQTCPAGACSK